LKNTMQNTDYMWYAIQTLTSQEKRVKDAILKMYRDNEGVKEVLVPEIEVVEMKQGERVYRKQKLMPGYVLIHLKPEKALFEQIRRINGVVNFLGASNPQPLSKKEMEEIFEKTESSDKTTRVEIRFKVDDKVRIIDGPFQNLTGKVLAIDPENEKVSVEVPILGRSTSVELDVMQVEAIN